VKRGIFGTRYNQFQSAEIKPFTVHVAMRENPIVNRLNKTKVEKQVDHEQERVDRIKRENAAKRAAAVEKVSFHVHPRLI
jgi:hypothetical protein